ncbi:DUF2100 domain-containing protein [Methanobrevibacter sp. DSM 116169]|uniref:DUF2100 domain-containing protein n=1 Tax=Methanobrevibacter sp. DSM 116169 TaxID=3242727 RepID=UPI0038FC422E
MNDMRMKQAQDLIHKATKKSNNGIFFNEADSGNIDVKLSESTLKNIIKSEEFIFNALPDHFLSKEDAVKYTDILIDARNSIDAQLMNFNVLNKEIDEINIDEITSNILFLTTKNNFKKSLKKLGVDVQRIIVADTPLLIEDMKEINPQIPDAALKGIEKKIEHVHNDIDRKKSSLNPSKIIVLAEKDINGNLLRKRSEKMYDAKTYLRDNLKDLTEEELKEIVENS